jgi:hypothetical protein
MIENDERVVLQRSKVGLRVQIIGTGILSFLLILFSNYVLGKLLGWTPNEGQFLKLLLTLFIIGGWLVTSIKLYMDWNIKKYEISSEAFIVHGRAGKWGRSKAIYRYDSIISMKMTQGFWGRKYNYGDVRLTVPRLDKDLIMHDINNPIDQLQEVQKRVSEHMNNSANLVT